MSKELITEEKLLAGFPIVRPTVGKLLTNYPVIVFRVPAPPDASAETLETVPLEMSSVVEVSGVPLPAAYEPCARGCTYEVCASRTTIAKDTSA